MPNPLLLLKGLVIVKDLVTPLFKKKTGRLGPDQKPERVVSKKRVAVTGVAGGLSAVVAIGVATGKIDAETAQALFDAITMVANTVEPAAIVTPVE